MSLFSQAFYGNTILQWLLAFGVILIFFLLSKTTYWFSKNILSKLTKKTKSKFDDILVDMLDEPLAFGIVTFGIWFGLGMLKFPNALNLMIDKAYRVILVLTIAWFISRVVDSLIKEYIRPLVKKTEGNLDDQLLPIIRKGFRLAIWIVAILIALNNAGYDVGAVLAGLGIGGLAFALAAQDTVANLFGSFTIFVDKPFMVNDRIVTNGFDGIVEEVGIRSTRIRTLEGRVVTISNAKIANSPILNISSEPSRKVSNTLGLTYDMDEAKIQKALEILNQIVDECEDVEDKRIVGFDSFGDFALNITFIYYIKKNSSIADTKTKINLEVLKRFANEGIEMAFPTQTIYTKEG